MGFADLDWRAVVEEEVIVRMKTRPTIFISGVSHEFGPFRDAVENEIEMKGCFAENQPGFHPDYGTVEEMLRRRLHDSDAVIHIVGFRFGGEPNQRPANVPRRSYTQMEFDIARELQKPVYVFLSAEPSVRQPPKPDELPEDAEAAALQGAHRDAVQKANHLYYFFKDQAELCKLVAEIPPVQAAGFKADISRIIKYAPTEIIGRESETAMLNDAWLKVRRAESPRPHILTFVALGGEGKTSLVAKWAADLAHQGWPGCDAVFAWSFYSQGTREQYAASSDLFLSEGLTFFGDAAMAGSAQGAFDKGRRLAQLVGERRALLILDGLEPLQYAPTSPTAGELKDQGLAALLKMLATNSNGLCVVTTRYAIPDLRAFIGKTLWEEKLTRLSTAAGVALLQSLGVKGSLRKTIPSAETQASGSPLWNEYEKLVEDVKGHALTLNLIGGYLRDATAGDIRRRDLINLEEADFEEQGGHAFRVMDAYVRSFESGGQCGEKAAEDRAKGRRALALLQLLGLFDRPATADCLKALWQPPAIAGLTEPLFTAEKKFLGLTQTFQSISEAQRNLSLKRLEDAKLLTVNRAEGSGELIALDTHPLLREYFARRIHQQQPEAWRAAHRRLYESLCETAPECTKYDEDDDLRARFGIRSDKSQPTLEDLQPLYQAVAHGCQAGLETDVLRNVLIQRIFRGTGDFGNFSMYRIGAVGSDLVALTHFFDTPWKSVSKSIRHDLDIWMLSAVAFRLRAIGRIAEAVEPIMSAFELAVDRQDNWQAAIRAPLVCDTRLVLGDISVAIKIGEEAVNFANSQDDEYWRIVSRSALADALFQSGDLVQSQHLNGNYIIDEEQAQAEHKTPYPHLHSVRGFRHCELFLASAERAAWQVCIARSLSEGLKREQRSSVSTADLLAACRIVSERATKMLKSDEQFGRLIDFGFHHLTLGRAALYEAILEQSTHSPSPDRVGSVSHPLPAGSVATQFSEEPRLSELSMAQYEIDAAVSGLRRAGHQDYIPRSILARAWLRSLTGAGAGPDSAQSDLDEAWEIAERGPMKLHMADIHLYRARLFFREKSYPWKSPQDDLAAAEKLINDCGYHRRDEELADAKQAILGQELK